MSEIQQNRWDQLVRRVAGLIGPGSKVNNTIGDLFPMLDVENVPGELLALGGTRLCLGAVSITGGAGFRAKIQLFNPVASGQLVTLDRFYINSGQAQSHRFGIDNTELGTNVKNAQYRDARFALSEEPVGLINTDIGTVAQGPIFGQIRMGANTTITVESTNSVAVLPPGTGFNVVAETVATNLAVTFLWRERAAEQSELSF